MRKVLGIALAIATVWFAFLFVVGVGAVVRDWHHIGPFHPDRAYRVDQWIYVTQFALATTAGFIAARRCLGAE